MKKAVQILIASTLAAMLLVIGVAFFSYKQAEPKHVPKYPTFKVNYNAIKSARNFTVLITHEGFFGGSRGTGVLIDSTHVLTCAHLIPRSPDSEIWIYPYPGNRVVKAKVVYASNRKDLAIFELDSKIELKKYPTFAEAATEGDPVIVVGNALGCMKWYVTHGIITGTQGIYTLTDALVQHGNSGGPWINNNGEVIAISDWGLVDDGKDSGVYGGVSAKEIKSFLKSWNNPTIMDIILGSLR